MMANTAENESPSNTSPASTTDASDVALNSATPSASSTSPETGAALHSTFNAADDQISSRSATTPEEDRGGFECFPKLPKELRDMVWKFAGNEPRVVRVKTVVSSDDWMRDDDSHLRRFITNTYRRAPHPEKGVQILQNISSTPPPAILAVNRESRAMGLKLYERTFGTQESVRFYHIGIEYIKNQLRSLQRFKRRDIERVEKINKLIDRLEKEDQAADSLDYDSKTFFNFDVDTLWLGNTQLVHTYEDFIDATKDVKERLQRLAFELPKHSDSELMKQRFYIFAKFPKLSELTFYAPEKSNLEDSDHENDCADAWHLLADPWVCDDCECHVNSFIDEYRRESDRGQLGYVISPERERSIQIRKLPILVRGCPIKEQALLGDPEAGGRNEENVEENNWRAFNQLLLYYNDEERSGSD